MLHWCHLNVILHQHLWFVGYLKIAFIPSYFSVLFIKWLLTSVTICTIKAFCIEMCFQLLESDSMLLNHKWHSQYMNLSNCRNHNEWYQHPNILFNQANYGDFDVLSFFSNQMPLNVSLYWNWCFHIQNSKSEDVEQTQSSSSHIIRFLQSSILAYWFNSILILILFLLLLIPFLLILIPSHQI